MKQYNVAILGATGMVGQRFVTLLENHPYFHIHYLAASSRSAGKPYEEVVQHRWKLEDPIPNSVKNHILLDAVKDKEQIANSVHFVFCALDLPVAALRQLEEDYAKLECPVISNNSAHRLTPDVPMIIPEINPHHAKIIPTQRLRLGTKRGFIAVKSNCSLQSYLPSLLPLTNFGVEKVMVSTYQAISGSGKTFVDWPEMSDNLIPYIEGEEKKSQEEPLKILGEIRENKIIPATKPIISAQCIRVPVSDGHMATISLSFRKKPSVEQILSSWENFVGIPQSQGLFSAPKQFLTYLHQEDFPQTKLHRNIEKGMGISLGRLREDSILDYKYVCLSHNTIRGAAGGAILMAEYLEFLGFLDPTIKE